MGAINVKNALPFRVDYIKTMDAEPDIDDENVWDIDREKAYMAPQWIELVTRYILEHFDQKYIALVAVNGLKRSRRLLKS